MFTNFSSNLPTEVHFYESCPSLLHRQRPRKKFKKFILPLQKSNGPSLTAVAMPWAKIKKKKLELNEVHTKTTELVRQRHEGKIIALKKFLKHERRSAAISLRQCQL